MIYLDYSATTPVNEEVLESFIKVSKNYIGNSNSLHKLGLESKKLIDAATNNIADILKVKPSEIIYTSGATESNNTAIKGICLKYQNRGKHIVTTKLEHSSIINSITYLESIGFEVSYVNVFDNGLVDLKHLEKIIRDDTILVSIASVSSEIGISQKINELAKIIKKCNNKTFFHCDITQSIGKEKIDLNNIDLASLSAQKFYGMKGIGILIKKENIVIEPLIHGGKSTTIYRGGTPATALIVSMAKALRLSYIDLDKKINYVNELNKYLKEKLLKIEDIHINSTEYSIPHIVNISIVDIKPETLQHALETEEIYVSTKTACSTKDISSSIYALTKNEEYAKSSIRISLSHLTTYDEVDKFIDVLNQKINELKIK